MKRNIILSLLVILNLCSCHLSTLLAQQNDVQKKVDDYIDAYVQMNQFSGTILITKNGQILVSKGYGYANCMSLRLVSEV